MGGALIEPSREESQSGLSRESDLDGQAGLATYVAIFNAVAYPPNLPSFKIEALEREAALIEQQPGHINFTSGDARTDPEVKAKRERDAEDYADVQVGIIMQNQQREQERERQEWARTSSTAGGVTMTGKEWDDLAKRLRSDDDLRTRIMTAFMARGMSEKEAEARYERAAEVAEIMAIPPSQRTAEQRATVRNAEADPTYKQDQTTINAERRGAAQPAPSSALQRDFAPAAQGYTKEGATPATTQPQPVTDASSAVEKLAVTVGSSPGM